MQLSKLFILAVIFTAVFAKLRFQDTRTVLAEMEKDQFGSAMLSAVQMNIAAESPIEEVTLLIEEILEQVKQDQNAADANNQTNQNTCDEQIESGTRQIVETKAAIDSIENAIKENDNILANAKVDLAQADRDFEETVEAIDTGSQQRRADHERWVEEDYQNAISIATLEEGVKLINHMIHGVAFAQIKTRYDKVLEKLSDNNSKHSSLFKPLISSLTQLATKLNYENVMKILELLNNIRTSIVEEQQAAKLAEETAAADWQKLLNHLASEKQRLSDKRARLRSLIEATTELLERLRSSLESNRVQLENLQQELASQVAKCNAQSETYAVESSERAREVEILVKLLEHIRQKYAAVSEYISDRAANAPVF